MTDIWIPGLERKDLGLDGGTYDQFDNPKVVWHRWEGTNWVYAEAAYKPYPPHIGVQIDLLQARQYIPLNKHSYSLRGSESDDDYCIQVEVSGFSNDSPNMTDAQCKWLGEHIARPIYELIGVPYIIVPQGFHGANEGIRPYLATTASPIRFKTDAALRAFSGHMGHQHAPPPDEHWDPGDLRIETILWYASANLRTKVQFTEDNMLTDIINAYELYCGRTAKRDETKYWYAQYVAFVQAGDTPVIAAAKILGAIANSAEAQSWASKNPQ